MPDSRFPLETVERLVRLVERHGLRELVVEDAGEVLRIRGGRWRQPASVAQAAAALPQPVSETQTTENIPAAPANGRALVAPMTGVFYRSPGPDHPPFVEVGDEIEAGQVFGIIEAMKVFSEVPAEESGTVAEIRADDGQLVRAGDVLMVLV